MAERTKRRAATALTILLLGLTVFQLLLVLGLPLGRAAWGGQHTTLPLALRVGSLISVGLYILAIRVARMRAGLTGASPDTPLARYGSWVCTLLFALGVALNTVSRSPWERWLMAPFALVLTVLFYLVARRAG